jgi:hypothetical protein
METILGKRSVRSFDVIDNMPSNVKRCVHEYGYSIVEVLTKHGITNPRHIDEIVTRVWAGARNSNQKQNIFSGLDVLLGKDILTANALIAYLAENGMALVPICPTKAMTEASMETVSDFSLRITKEEKHKRRLMAALRAGMTEIRAIGNKHYD